MTGVTDRVEAAAREAAVTLAQGHQTDGADPVLARAQERETKKLPTLRGRLVLNLFYEASTRTSSSFELAAKRLSADTLTLRSAGSSVDKGESLKDTALTLSAYGPDVIVIRHPQAGAPGLVASLTEAHVVNAGDGKHQHPTQALLDLYAMQEAFGRLEGLHVAIVGDVLHSRVARSLVQGLQLMGASVVLVGPPPLLPEGLAPATHGRFGLPIQAIDLLVVHHREFRLQQVVQATVTEAAAYLRQLDQSQRQRLCGRRRYGLMTESIAGQPRKAASPALTDRCQFAHAPDCLALALRG